MSDIDDVNAPEALQLAEDGHHCRVVLLIMGTRSRKVFFERNEIAHFGYVEQRLTLRAAFNLMDSQQLSSSRPYAVALRLRKARLSVVGKTQSAFLPNRIDDDLLHRELIAIRQKSCRPWQ
jgi:hypothetical protein